MRMRRGTWNLRSQRCFERVQKALAVANARGSVRVIHYSVQGNHIHLIVEGDDRRSLSNGMRALSISLARRLNRLMGVTGPRFADRFHERVLGSPTQVRNALKYVLENHAHHVRGAVVDELSSGPWFAHWRAGVRMPRWLPCTGPPTVDPESWVLRGGWRRAGREI
jgi:REP element-mobilizing transposase RayT